VPIDVLAIEVQNDNGVDVQSSFQSGNLTPESSSAVTTLASDLVLFVGADHNATFSSYPSGQTAIPGYATPLTNITAWGSSQTQASPGTASSSRNITGTSITWAAVSIAIRASSPGGTVYCQAGTYVLKAPIGNTGNYQCVIFEAGSNLTGVYASLNPGGSPLEALIWVAQDVASASFGALAAYHHVEWKGNGCVINLYDSASSNYIVVNSVFEYSVNGPLISGIPQAYLVELDNFELMNLSGSAIYFQTHNGGGSHPDVTQQASQWKISRIYAHSWNPGSTVSISWIVGISSVREFHLDQLFLDGASRPASVGTGLIVVWSNGGDTSDIRVTNSVLIDSTSAASGGVVWLEGSTTTSGGEITSRIYFENCVLKSPAYNANAIVATDTFGGTPTNPAFITDFEFKLCEFENSGVNLVNNGNGVAHLGFGRILDSRFIGLPTGSNAVSGSLKGRSPGATGQPPRGGITSTPYTYVNNDGFDETVVVTGSGITAISINGVALSTSQLYGAFFLRPGDSIKVTYPSGSISFVVIPQ
jgi:hypothetical protein